MQLNRLLAGTAEANAESHARNATVGEEAGCKLSTHGLANGKLSAGV